MGFASRSASIIRYRVRGEPDGPFWETVDQGVKAGAFKEVESTGEMVGIGWTSMDDFTDNLARGGSYVMGNYVAISMRIDTVRVPARILALHLKQETQKMLQQSGQRRLSSSQRRELKDRIKETLKQQVFPSIQISDLIWNTTSGVVYFGTHSIKARELMEEHFKKCFGLTLIPLIPYIRAEEVLDDKDLKFRLENLRPCSMIP